MKKIGIVMGSDSDLPVVEKAMATLEKFGVPFEAHVYSAHRTPVEASEFAKGARENGFGAIIAAAGKAAHLAGAMAANTTLPVIGIPIKSSTLDGLDALLSTVQMPSGLPVATVAIDGAENAALLAIQILAVEDKDLAAKLDAARAEAAAKVASAHSCVMRLEHGYDTMLEGDGANLSQGQRQLLNIARAAISKAAWQKSSERISVFILFPFQLVINHVRKG